MKDVYKQNRWAAVKTFLYMLKVKFLRSKLSMGGSFGLRRQKMQIQLRKREAADNFFRRLVPMSGL